MKNKNDPPLGGSNSCKISVNFWHSSPRVPQALTCTWTAASMEVEKREILEQSCPDILGWRCAKGPNHTCLVLFHLDCRIDFFIANRPITRSRYNKWLGMGSGFNSIHCQLESTKDGAFNQCSPSRGCSSEAPPSAILKDYEHGLCFLQCAWQNETVGQWSWCCVSFFYCILYCYLVVCYILLLVTDKLEMTTCLADKIWILELEHFKSKDRRLNMTSWKPSHPSFEVALINWFGRWRIHLQARILLEDCSQ